MKTALEALMETLEAGTWKPQIPPDRAARPNHTSPLPVERPATCLPTCLEHDRVLIHAEGCPTVEAMRRSRKNCVWFEAADPDPVGDAVRDLLRPGEWIDERGVIRKVQ